MGKQITKSQEDLALLSEIGQQITQQLSVVKINELVYNSLSEVMSTESFGIGLHNADNNSIEFPGHIEEGKVLKGAAFNLEEERLGTVCFNDDIDILVGNFREDAKKYLKNFDLAIAGREVKSLIYVPLKIKDEKIGVVTVQSFEENAYSEDHLSFIKSLGVYIAIALENARLYENMEKLVDERTREVVAQKEALESTHESAVLLNKIGNELISTLDIDEIFTSLHANVNELMDATCFGIRLYDKERDLVIYKYEIEDGVKDEEILEIPMTNPNNLSVWCIKNREPILIYDLEKEYEKYVDEIKMTKGGYTRSFVVQPLMRGEDILGVIILQSYETNAYSEYDLTILETLASYAVIALGNAEQFDQMDKQVQESSAEIQKTREDTELVSEIGRMISSSLDLEEIMKTFYQSLKELMDAQCFAVRLINNDSGLIECAYEVDRGERVYDLTIPLGKKNDLSNWCIENQKEIHINDIRTEHTKYMEEFSELYGAEVLSMLFVPLVFDGKVLGIITVQRENENGFTEYHLNILKALGVYLSSAIHNAQSYERIENEISLRTKEIEKSNQNLAILNALGREITSLHSAEEIIEKVYATIQHHISLDSFGIGILDDQAGVIRYPGYIENDEITNTYVDDLNDDILATRCFNSKETIHVNSDKELQEFVGRDYQAGHEHRCESIIYVPMLIADMCMGVVTVQSFTKGAYTTTDRQFVENLASYVAVALENAQSFTSLEKISQLGKEATSSHDLTQIGKLACEQLSKMMPIDSFMFCAYNEITDEMSYIYIYEDDEEQEIPEPILVADRKTAFPTAIKEKRELVFRNQEQWKSEVEYYVLEGTINTINTLCAFPLIFQDKVIGVLSVQADKEDAYLKKHLEILRNVATTLSVAVYNARSYESVRSLGEMTKSIATILDLSEIGKVVYEYLGTVMKIDSFVLSSYNKANDILMPEYVVDMGDVVEELKGQELGDSALASLVIKENKEIVTKEAQEVLDMLGIAKPIAGEATNSVIYLPIRYDKEVIGVISAQCLKKDVYTTQDIDILRSVASSLALAINNSNTHYKTMKIGKIGEEIATMLDMSQISSHAYERVQDIFKLNTFVIALYDSRKDRLIYRGTEFGETMEEAEVEISDESLAGYVFKNQKTVRLGVWEEAAEYIKIKVDREEQVVSGSRTDSIIYSPVISQNKCVGVLTIQSTEFHVYTKEDEILVENLASYVGAAYSNAETFEDMELITDIGREVTASIDIIEIADKLYERISELIDMDSFAVGIYSSMNDTVTYIRGYEDGVVFDREYVKELIGEDSLVSYCVKNQADVITGTFEDDLKYLGSVQDSVVGSDTPSVIYVPLIFENRVLGVVTVQSKKENIYDKSDLDVIKNLASYLSVAINNANSHEALETIGRIGQELTSISSAMDINYIAYERLKNVMAVDGFSVGIYNDVTYTLDYPGYIEEGVVMDPLKQSLDDTSLGVHCFKNQSVVHISSADDYAQYDLDESYKIKGKQTGSVIYVPMMLGTECVGVITVQAFERGLYTAHDVAFMERLAPYVAIALQNAQSFESIQALGEISEVITSTFDLSEVIDLLYDRIKKLMSASTMYVATYEPHLDQFTVAKQYENGELLRENVPLPIIRDKSLFSYVLTENKAVHLNHDKELTKLLPNRERGDDYHKGQKTHSMLCVPVVYDQEVLGCISVQSTEIGIYTERHFELFKNVASSVAIAMNNIRAYEEMEQAEMQIREKNQEIVDSINYAKHIQTAMLPKEGVLNDQFADSFILFEPRDIVSGDFYWYRHFPADSATVVSVADCTGHGVPGGFMSMMGNELLNRTIGDPMVKNPGHALEIIDERIRRNLNDESSSSHTNDGMDMTLCVFVWDRKVLQFAGANRPLVRVRDNELVSIKPNKNGVGGRNDGKKEFTFEELDLQEGDCYYMYTDGYPDQFGGPKGKKFMRKRLNKLLLEIHKKPMAEQFKILRDALMEWKDNHEQIDDICLMGVRV